MIKTNKSRALTTLEEEKNCPDNFFVRTTFLSRQKCIYHQVEICLKISLGGNSYQYKRPALSRLMLAVLEQVLWNILVRFQENGGRVVIRSTDPVKPNFDTVCES